eukprot:CAMPEP_0172461066 /NCGR_PEP_ID=MMETSP1065-20121228/39300_1 /TAXON_ID=265537 /ORGANISM="Amphiprora paludosa, Strain CCMP125" /LENGTH=92 /DNA_ID=CAMNT_0013216271 /DNA_START=75 /DNA_END=351 /DNA_ORIENTATION=-
MKYDFVWGGSCEEVGPKPTPDDAAFGRPWQQTQEWQVHSITRNKWQKEDQEDVLVPLGSWMDRFEMTVLWRERGIYTTLARHERFKAKKKRS